MRTTIIPAQITTVEDKIAGNFTLPQILILIIPVLWTTFVYVLFPPSMKLVYYKMFVSLIVLFISLSLAIRVKGKLVLQWLIILLKYNLRPKYYLFNKNEAYLRQIDLPIFKKMSLLNFTKRTVKQKIKAASPALHADDRLKLDLFMLHKNYAMNFKAGKKGGISVALKQVEKKS